MAKLYFRYGAMNSGKSTAMLQAAFNYEERGQQVLLGKPQIDTKGDSAIVSRLGVSRPVDFVLSPGEDAYRAFSAQREQVRARTGLDVSCLLIDEAQFLTPRQVRQLHRLAHRSALPVICYGLRSDFRGEAFPGSAQLLTLADDLEEMKTICACARKASMNVRLAADGRRVTEGEQVEIGGNDRYRAVCPSCFYSDVDADADQAPGLFG